MIDKLDGTSYEELMELKIDVEYELRQFRPVRIKKKWKRCGKETCFCAAGPGDGSWGNLHGPYLFAQFVDHSTKRTRSISLGKYYDQEAVDEVSDQSLDFSEFFHLTEADYGKMGQADKDKNRWAIRLTEADFELFHGIRWIEDQLDRHGTFYGTEANYEAYMAARGEISEQKAGLTHIWTREYGLASPAGQRALKGLLQKNYYLKQI